MSKEDKLAKKEAKAAKKEAKKTAKAEKAQQKYEAKVAKKHQKAYNKFVKKANKKNKKGEGKPGYTAIVIPDLDDYKSKKELKAIKKDDKAYEKYKKKITKKNAKLEKKAAKKGKPFEPIPIPDRDEFITGGGNTGGKVVWMIIKIILCWLLIYFIVMWLLYVGPAVSSKKTEETTTEAGEKVSQTYQPYQNKHEITTTPTYSVADAKRFLEQIIHDQYSEIGYSSDVSSTEISSRGTSVVENTDCYILTCSGKTFAVSTKLSACYQSKNGKWVPLTFNNTDRLF